MSESPEAQDYYTVLGIIRAATADQIRSAFHRFAREHHPDTFVDAPDEERDRHTELYQLGSEAYQVLLDPVKRKIYDEGLLQGRVRYSADRAEETRRTMRPPGGVMLNSSKARVFFTRAHKAMKAEDWPQAKLNLQMALQNEPDNEDLKGKLDEVLERMESG
ncbi:MAG: DnaJ domain-containing protein [Myxococcales bacterium]|nr:DnaJ domain-containing protein [Myxococcales bacterium]MDH3484714.1 DnaJ domain-containing protein [Myxococcales bacterium]